VVRAKKLVVTNIKKPLAGLLEGRYFVGFGLEFAQNGKGVRWATYRRGLVAPRISTLCPYINPNLNNIAGIAAIMPRMITISSCHDLSITSTP
jgi:hypothetical protein